MTKLCVFDLDGTISNTLQSLHYYCNKALTECGFPAGIEEKKIQYMVGSGASVLLQRLLTESIGSYTEGQLAELHGVYSRLYAENPMYLVHPYDGMVELLETLQSRGILLAVLSNKPDDMTKIIAKKLYPTIDFALCRGQVLGFPKKPAPDGLWLILDTLDVPRSEALYIGDTGVDMKTGKTASVATIGVTWGFRTPQELEEAGADRLIHHPRELLELI